MAEKKDWYVGASSLHDEIKRTTCAVDTFRLTRVFHIYSRVNSLMQMCRDLKKCENSVTKHIIEDKMKEVAYELRHYKIFDDRFEEMFDEGR